MRRRDLLIGAAALAACAPVRTMPPPPPFPMRRAVNLGNALEAPEEGEWGYRIEDSHLAAIAEAGFDGVRLPVRWSEHADEDPPFTISPALMARVEHVVTTSLALGLKVQLDAHHYEELIEEGPHSEHRRRFLAIWAQIAERFSSAPPELLFEPFNEPNGRAWNGSRLRQLQKQVVETIRQTNADRLIVLGPPSWNSIDALRNWRPPEGDNIAVTVHFYEPYNFTHHGAEWLEEDAPRFDRVWGREGDRAEIADHITNAAEWAQANGYAIQLGEFGVNERVPVTQRAAWTRAVRDACEARGIGWCVWDFAAAFPIYDAARGMFIPEMREALLG